MKLARGTCGVARARSAMPSEPVTLAELAHLPALLREAEAAIAELRQRIGVLELEALVAAAAKSREALQ